MTDTIIQTPPRQWSGKNALLLSLLCLIAGVVGGWAIRGVQYSYTNASKTASVSTPDATPAAAPVAAPTSNQTRQAADAQAQPLLEKLKTDPNNPALLTTIGNVYYDAQQYSIAVDYYGRVLKSKPSDAAVRTDMATAFWYMGDANTAIAEFDKALGYEPNNPNTLFNRGLVKWQGKKDAAGALADWNKLLAVDPNYEAKDKVQQMITEVTKHTAQQTK
jgi:cytochrome c-type biogenesis protein CcmH/NrfG